MRIISALLLLGQVWLRLLQGKTCYRNILEHMVKVGPGSISPVLLVSFFAGMIFTIQTARELVQFGAVDAVGGAFALAFCRELAPILTASIIAGQVGSAFAAEIGAMIVTEQVDALYMLRDFQEINYPKKIKRQHLFGNDNYCDSERKGLPLATPSSF